MPRGASCSSFLEHQKQCFSAYQGINYQEKQNYDDGGRNFDDNDKRYKKHCQRHNGPRVLTLST